MVVAGPYCTMLLADWGAEVIRLDTTQVFVPFTRGTRARPSKAYVETAKILGYGYAGNDPGQRPWNKYAMFQNHARNKLSVTLDCRQAEGLDVFKRLAAISDVIVENNVPENLEKLGVTYDLARAARPDVIMLRMPPYGAQGEYKNFRAFGSHIEAVAGHVWIRGYPDTDLSMRGVLPVADGPSGVGGAFAVVAALRHRARSGQGQLIEFSQTEHFATYLGEALMEYSMNKCNVEPPGNRHPRFAPHGCYRCAGDDKWIAIAVSKEEEWQALCRVMGQPAWTKDPDLDSHEGRRRRHDEIDAHIEAWTSRHGHYEAMRLLQGAGVPAGAVIDESEVHTDPHVRARGMVERVEHTDAGAHLYAAPGFRMAATPNSIRTPPCRLGEHNDRVYKDLLGLSAAEYGELERSGHIGMDYAPHVT